MGYLEEDEIRVSAPGSDNPECLSRHMFVIVCCEVDFPGPGCGHTALLPSVLQRSRVMSRRDDDDDIEAGEREPLAGSRDDPASPHPRCVPPF